MKKFLILAISCALIFSLTACTTTEKNVATWGAGGAALGALGGAAFGKGSGAVLAGATIGAIAGGVIGYSRTKNGVRYCKYRNSHGHVYEARCR